MREQEGVQAYLDLDPRTVVAEWPFPKEGTLRERLTYLLNYAVLAPSSHNSQPWQFRVEEDGVELYADRLRALPVSDPMDRELAMSCGAALLTLRVAMSRFGLRPRVGMVPKPHMADLLARVEVESFDSPSPQIEHLFGAITDRRTNRAAFKDRPIREDCLDRLSSAVQAEGASMRFMSEPDEREVVGRAVCEADRIQGSNPAFRRELASWIHPNRAATGDGMPGFGDSLGKLASYLGPLVVRTFDWGNRQAARDDQIIQGSPVLALLETKQDDIRAWVSAGQGLARALLTATADGIQASFLNQPIEIPEMRERLRSSLGTRGHPQLLVRLGHGPPARETPRRAVRSVLLGDTRQ